MKKVLDLKNASCIFYKNSNSKKNLLGFFELNFEFCSNWSELPKHFDFLWKLKIINEQIWKLQFFCFTPRVKIPRENCQFWSCRLSGLIFFMFCPCFQLILDEIIFFHDNWGETLDLAARKPRLFWSCYLSYLQFKTP
jgi:hypothetical protein